MGCGICWEMVPEALAVALKLTYPRNITNMIEIKQLATVLATLAPPSHEVPQQRCVVRCSRQQHAVPGERQGCDAVAMAREPGQLCWNSMGFSRADCTNPNILSAKIHTCAMALDARGDCAQEPQLSVPLTAFDFWSASAF